MKLKKRSTTKNKLIKKHKVKYTEMTLYTDLVIKHERTCLQSVGITKEDKVYKNKPEKCCKCECDKLVALEVLGASDEVLFWNCAECDHLHLKFSKAITESYLKKGEGLWSNPNDWVPPNEHTLN